LSQAHTAEIYTHKSTSYVYKICHHSRGNQMNSIKYKIYTEMYERSVVCVYMD